MTPAQRAAALRLADQYKRNDSFWADEVHKFLRELAAEPVQEPVAWHVCSVNNDGSLSLEHAAAWEEAAHEHINDAINEDDIEEASSWVVRPVYASPQPQQTEPSQDTPPQRQPLSDEQIGDIFHAARNAKIGASTDNSRHRLSVVEIARAIEAAHGIGETK